MRKIQTVIDQYVAEDGKVFNDEQECQHYENSLTTIYFKIDTDNYMDLYKIIGIQESMSRYLDKLFQQQYGNTWFIHPLSDCVIPTYHIRNISHYNFLDEMEDQMYDNFYSLKMSDHCTGFVTNKDCEFFTNVTGDI